jgi:SAM-dependent methyltransferase
MTLECGCGDGLASIFLARHKEANACAIDFSGQAINLASLNAVENATRLKVALADIRALPFRNGTFDLTFSLGVNEHLQLGDRERAFLEMVRVTKAGGKIIIDVPNRFSILYRIGMSVRKALDRWPVGLEIPYSKQELIRLCRTSGDVVGVRLRHWGFFDSMLFLIPVSLWGAIPVKELDAIFDNSPLRRLGRGLTFEGVKMTSS